MSSNNENLGLRVLFRGRVLNLDAWDENLANSNSDGRVSFVRRASRKDTRQVLERVLRYSRKFVPDIAKEKYEKGLRNLLNK